MSERRDRDPAEEQAEFVRACAAFTPDEAYTAEADEWLDAPLAPLPEWND